MDQYRIHVEACGSRTERCPKCKEYIQKKYLEQHRLENICTRPREDLEEEKKSAKKIPVKSYSPVHANVKKVENPQRFGASIVNKNPEKPKISSKIERKVQKRENSSEDESDMNEIPIEPIGRLDNHSPGPQRRDFFTGDLREMGTQSTQNLLDDDEILQLVLEESKQDVLGLSQEEVDLNKALLESLEEKNFN